MPPHYRPIKGEREAELRRVVSPPAQPMLGETPRDPTVNDLKDALDLVDWYSANASHLLNHVGERGVCDGPRCKTAIFWVVHLNGKRTPYNTEGLPHFIECVDRDRFRRKR